MTIKAIETVYRGHLFRSRLEARWAGFFDILGWTWTYEPFDWPGYIPDFLIHGQGGSLVVEVKPAMTYEALAASWERYGPVVNAECQTDFLIVGGSPIIPTTPNPSERNTGGLLAEKMTGSDSNGWAFADGPAIWSDCLPSCPSQIGITHEIMSFHSRPCGCYDGNIRVAAPGLQRRKLEDAWGHAHRLTRWVQGQPKNRKPARSGRAPY